MKTKSSKSNITLFSNKDEKGRVLTYSVIDTDSKMNKQDFKEFNSLKEARKYIKKLR